MRSAPALGLADNANVGKSKDYDREEKDVAVGMKFAVALTVGKCQELWADSLGQMWTIRSQIERCGNSVGKRA